MAADGCLAEPSREQRLAEARGPIKVPLRYHQDRRGSRFLEGCPANHGCTFARPNFATVPKAGLRWHFPSRSMSYVRSVPTRLPTTPAQEFCDIIHRSIDCVRLGPCVACLSDAVPGRASGGRSGRGLGGSGLDHHPGAERAGSRRRAAARMGAGGRDRRRVARRRIGVLDRASQPSAKSSAPGR